MAKRKAAHHSAGLSAARRKLSDFSSWNFIIFLTLAFILLVVVLGAMSDLSLDLRAKAGLRCPRMKLPQPEACPGGIWEYYRGKNTCPEFRCVPKPGPVMK